LALLAVALIGSGALVARYALPRSAPRPGSAPAPAPAPTVSQPGPRSTGDLIAPTGAQPSLTLPARPADALASWAAEVGPVAQIPPVALQAYGYAQLSMESTNPQCHLTWTTLAGIGEVESQHGQRGGAVLSPTGRSIPPILGPALDGSGGRPLVADTDAGAFDGDPNFDHQMGPMGILPSAWKLYAIDADADGILDPYDVDDASLAMGRLLCSGGDDLSRFDGWSKAVARQHAGDAYAKTVFDAADSYGQRTRNIG
jgi:membrane-bound lytic murein transglycosylase B